MSETMRDRNALKPILIELCALAADVIAPYFRKKLNVENKLVDDGEFDPVTVADREAETAIREFIANRFPEDSIYGEEFPPKEGAGPHSWVIDPIDGTKAFVCGLPTWATLIGICYDGKPIFGAMSQPLVGDIFMGGLGKSELVRAEQETILSTRGEARLIDGTLFATSPDMFQGPEKIAFEALSRAVRMTRFGVDSYAYAMLAAGQIDLVVESGLGFYDIAALIPVIEAAGGVVSDWEGNEIRQGGRVIAAANESIHEQAMLTLQGKLASN